MMKKTQRRRTLSIVLVLCMVMSIIPANPLVALGMEAAQEEAFKPAALEALEEMFGEDAENMYELLFSLGIIDGEGQELFYDIQFDGYSYTLEEIYPLLYDPEMDLSQVAFVDETPITLGDLRTLVELEEEMARLYNEYLLPGDVEVTPEHVDSFLSLYNQLTTEGIDFSETPGFMDATSLKGEAIDGQVSVTVTLDKDADGVPKMTFTKPDKWRDVEFAFAYEIVHGSTMDIDFNILGEGIVIPSGQTQVALPLSSLITDDILEGFRGITTVDDTSRYDGYSTDPLEVMRDLLWRNYGRTFYIHCFDFENFDFMEIDADLRPENNEITVNSTMPKVLATSSHIWAGGAYVSFDIHAGNEIDNEGYYEYLMDEYKYVRNDRNSVPKEEFIQKFTDMSLPPTKSTYYTGQIVPIRMTYARAVGKMPDNMIQGQRAYYFNCDYHHPSTGATRYPLYQTSCARGRGPSGSLELLSITNRTDIQFVVGRDGKAKALDQKYGKANTVIGAYYGSGEWWNPYTISALPELFANGALNASSSKTPKQEHTARIQGNPIILWFDIPYGSKGWHGMYQGIYGNARHDSALGEYNFDVRGNTPLTNASNITFDYDRSDAPLHLELDKASYKLGDIATVTLTLEDHGDKSIWLTQGFDPDISSKLRVSVGDRFTDFVPMTYDASVSDVQMSVFTGTFEITNDFMTDGITNPGSGCAKIYYNRHETYENDLKYFSMLRNQEDAIANFTVEAIKLICEEDLSMVYPDPWPSGTPFKVGLLSKTLTQLDYNRAALIEGGFDFIDKDQFIWSSSDPTVATIDREGRISPKKRGTVTFTLTALNGEQPDGHNAVSIQTETIAIISDSTKGLIVPADFNEIHVRKGSDAPISWTANLPEGTNFKVEFFAGNFDANGLNDREPDRVWQAPSTASLVDARGFSVPGELLQEISAANPSYTVRISAPNPDIQDDTLWALAYIRVLSHPAVLRLKHLPNINVSDSVGTVELSWTLENYDAKNKGHEFEFFVTRNGQRMGEITDVNGLTPTGQGAYSGNFSVSITPVTGGDRFKDVYTVNLRAKNAYDSTWSFDSVVFYAHKYGGMKITVDGVNQSSDQLSNIDMIRNMTNQQRLELKRNIPLQRELTVNYSDYTDINMADQFHWNTSDYGILPIYYNSLGSLIYEKDYVTPSYLPTQKFIMYGKSDGTGTVTATHGATGIKAELDVKVETLRNKLYLFQFYPKAETEVTYTNGNGQTVTVCSDHSGALALFDEHGITSDIKAMSEDAGRVYMGTYSKYLLMTQESDPLIRLYPLNTFKMRQVAKAEIFIKKPDGTPYTGSVTYSAGVYKNGNYCEPAEKRKQSMTLAGDGKLDVQFDTTLFYSTAAGESGDFLLDAGDNFQFIFEIKTEAYNPMLVFVDGNINPDNEMRLGSKIHYLTTPGKAQNVAMAAQNMWYGHREIGVPIKDYNGYFGLSDDIDQMTVETIFLWENPEDYTSHAVAFMEDSTGRRPEGQSSKTVKYPFSDHVYTIHEQIYDENTMWLSAGEQRSLIYAVEDGRTYSEKVASKRTFAQNATLINMLGVKEITDSQVDSLIESISSQLSGGIDLKGMKISENEIIALMLENISNVDFSSGPLQFKMQPTENPLRYKALVAVSIGNIPESILEVDGGASSDYLVGEKDISLIPGPKALLQMRKGTYMKEQKKDYDDAVAGKKDVGALYAFGGYYEMEIFFNQRTAQWEFITVGGGFNAGGGVEVTFLSNFFAGPVPVTLELKIGGAVEVGTMVNVLRARTNTGIVGSEGSYDLNWSNANSVNDFLITLRAMVFLRAFAGVGFDYNVVALKLGIFGQVQFEYRMALLRRAYAENPSDENKWGHALSLGGEIGLEFKAKCLFVETTYKYTLVKVSNTWLLMEWKNINSYWKKTTGRDITGATVKQAVLAYASAMDMNIFEDDVSYVMAVEDRGYLLEHDRTWDSGNPFVLFSLDTENAAPDILQSNAYPYSNPQFTDDGNIFVYMSDAGSTDIEDTVASWARLDNRTGKYADRGEIIPQDQYGDAYLSVAGNEELAAAVWVRQHEPLNFPAGSKISNADLAVMANSTEIMLSIYQNGQWSSGIRLTDNKTPDLSPVVAVADGKVFVAWRGVFSGDANNPLDFVQRDDILYTIYDAKNSTQSSIDTLYNGTDGAVKGLSAHGLKDGTFATAYALEVKNGASNGGYGISDVAYAVIGDDTGNVIRNLKVTSGNGLNEDPRLTSAVFADGQERFILAYHAAKDGAEARDIEMAAFEPSGDLYPHFIDSLGRVLQSNNITVGPGFRFAGTQEGKLDELSLIWKELSYAEPENLWDEINTDHVKEPELRDVLKAVKFIEQDGEIYLSGAIDVASMPNMTSIDAFDAYILNDEKEPTVKAIIGGTEYKVNGDTISGLYTATETYQNNFTVADVFLSPYDIEKGMDLPILVTVVNQGFAPIEKLEVTVGGQKTEFDDIIMPNVSNSLTVYYEVPEKIIDQELTVKAYFADGNNSTATIDGIMLELDVADIGVSTPNIVSEKDGIREMLVPIFNLSDAKLAGSGAAVKVGIYDDGMFGDENLLMPIVTIDGDDDLGLIDNGGYSERMLFNIKEYINKLGLDEIPENGVRIWIRAWTERNGEYVQDYFTQNDSTSIEFENLSVKNNNDRTKITMEFQSGADGTNVDLTLQNLIMEPEENGNLLLTLHDQKGAVLETKLARDRGNLINMAAEQAVDVQVSFKQAGDRISAMYFTDTPSSGKIKLATASIQGYVVNLDPDVTAYNLSALNLQKSEMKFVANHMDADIKVEFTDGTMITNQSDGSLVFTRNMVLTDNNAGGNDFTVTVSHAHGTDSVYNFSLENKSTQGENPTERFVVTVENGTGSGSFAPGQTVSISAGTPPEGMRFKKWTASPAVAFKDANSAATTFTMPANAVTVTANWEYTGGGGSNSSSGLQPSTPPANTASGMINGMPVDLTHNTGNSVLLELKTGEVSKYPLKDNAFAVEIKSQGAINVRFPVSAILATNASVLQIKADYGTVILTRKMMEAYSLAHGDTFEISIRPGSFIVEFLKNGKVFNYNDPTNPFFVQIPVKIAVGTSASAYVAVKKEITGNTTIPYSICNNGQVTFQTAATGTFDVMNHDKTFMDVGRHWAMGNITFAAARGMFGGVGNDLFSPDTPMTRAMFTQVLANIEGVDLSVYKTSRFTDVKEDAWYSAAVEWSADMGIVSGMGSGLFKPEDNISREQMAAMLMNYVGYKGYQLPEELTASFNDEASIAPWALDAVRRVQGAGIVSGKPGNAYDPHGLASRAEVATIFANFVNVYISNQVTVEYDEQ